MENNTITEIIEHPRFTGLWTYRPFGRKRKFCATVIVNGEPNETRMFIDWRDALKQAAEIIAETERES